MRLIKICKIFFVPFSFIYLVIVSLRNLFYSARFFKVHSVDARVISVGNITWGGSGKTPAVLSILEAASREGPKPAVLTRGYGNDEEGLFTRLAPGALLMVGKDRVKSGLEAINTHSVKTILLDDGFQHRRLKRDLDIVCIDATNPFGNGWVIPVGILREGLGGLKRADIFLITKVDLASDKKSLENLEMKLKKINPQALIVKSVHKAQHFYKLSDEKVVDIDGLKNKDIVLVSAIGSPDSFEKIVLNLGLKVKRHFVFGDHYWYKEKDLEKIDAYCKKNGIDAVITTEKDAVKLRSLSYIAKFYVLSIRLKIIENEKAFYNRLFGSYSS